MSMDGLVILTLIVSIASCTAHWNESDNRREVDLERARIEKQDCFRHAQAVG